jgi:hypothetical protein
LYFRLGHALTYNIYIYGRMLFNLNVGICDTIYVIEIRLGHALAYNTFIYGKFEELHLGKPAFQKVLSDTCIFISKLNFDNLELR